MHHSALLPVQNLCLSFPLAWQQRELHKKRGRWRLLGPVSDPWKADIATVELKIVFLPMVDGATNLVLAMGTVVADLVILFSMAVSPATATRVVASYSQTTNSYMHYWVKRLQGKEANSDPMADKIDSLGPAITFRLMKAGTGPTFPNKRHGTKDDKVIYCLSFFSIQDWTEEKMSNRGPVKRLKNMELAWRAKEEEEESAGKSMGLIEWSTSCFHLMSNGIVLNILSSSHVIQGWFCHNVLFTICKILIFKKTI